jgi:hypothetical protein
VIVPGGNSHAKGILGIVRNDSVAKQLPFEDVEPVSPPPRRRETQSSQREPPSSKLRRNALNVPNLAVVDPNLVEQSSRRTVRAKRKRRDEDEGDFRMNLATNCEWAAEYTAAKRRKRESPPPPTPAVKSAYKAPRRDREFARPISGDKGSQKKRRIVANRPLKSLQDAANSTTTTSNDLAAIPNDKITERNPPRTDREFDPPITGSSGPPMRKRRIEPEVNSAASNDSHSLPQEQKTDHEAKRDGSFIPIKFGNNAPQRKRARFPLKPQTEAAERNFGSKDSSAAPKEQIDEMETEKEVQVPLQPAKVELPQESIVSPTETPPIDPQVVEDLDATVDLDSDKEERDVSRSKKRKRDVSSPSITEELQSTSKPLPFRLEFIPDAQNLPPDPKRRRLTFREVEEAIGKACDLSYPKPRAPELKMPIVDWSIEYVDPDELEIARLKANLTPPEAKNLTRTNPPPTPSTPTRPAPQVGFSTASGTNSVPEGRFSPKAEPPPKNDIFKLWAVPNLSATFTAPPKFEISTIPKVAESTTQAVRPSSPMAPFAPPQFPPPPFAPPQFPPPPFAPLQFPPPPFAPPPFAPSPFGAGFMSDQNVDNIRQSGFYPGLSSAAPGSAFAQPSTFPFSPTTKSSLATVVGPSNSVPGVGSGRSAMRSQSKPTALLSSSVFDRSSAKQPSRDATSAQLGQFAINPKSAAFGGGMFSTTGNQKPPISSNNFTTVGTAPAATTSKGPVTDDFKRTFLTNLNHGPTATPERKQNPTPAASSFSTNPFNSTPGLVVNPPPSAKIQRQDASGQMPPPAPTNPFSSTPGLVLNPPPSAKVQRQDVSGQMPPPAPRNTFTQGADGPSRTSSGAKPKPKKKGDKKQAGNKPFDETDADSVYAWVRGSSSSGQSQAVTSFSNKFDAPTVVPHASPVAPPAASAKPAVSFGNSFGGTASAIPRGFHGARFSGSLSTTLSPAQPTPKNAAMSFSGTGNAAKANNLAVSQAACGNAAPFGSPNSNAPPSNNLSTFQSNPFDAASTQQRQQQQRQQQQQQQPAASPRRRIRVVKKPTASDQSDDMSL